MAAGRPSDYDPSYCEKVIMLGKLGMSVVEMASEIGVTRTTLERSWPESHPEFLQALTSAREASQAWWEALGRTHVVEEPGNAKLNSSIWSRSMAARFPNDWREKTEQKIEGEITTITRRVLDPKK